jgi:hypothetical protein
MSYGVNLHQDAEGKLSIGGVATEKYQSDALNLGFPSAYQSVYAARHLPERYFPTKERPPMTMWAGNDLQAQYHEQKRVDADYMAGAKVRATQLSRMRYVGTPHGRGLLPPAVLGQRIFANPSQGALYSYSARQSHPDAPFHYAGGGDYTSEFKGGVLRSAKGQAHGIARLRDRVGQLNAIATAAADFTSGTMPSSTGATTQSINPSAVSPSIELNLLLQGIQDALIQGPSRGGDTTTKLDKFDLATASRALGLIFRMVPEANSDFVEDTQAKVQNILELLNGLLDDETESAGMSVSARETALSLQTIFTKLNVYLTRMIAGAPVQRQETRFNPLTGQQEVQNVLSQEQGENLSNPERVALSKNLVSSLGFSKMLKYAVDADPSGLLGTANADRLFNAQQSQRFRVGDMDEEDDDDDGDFDRPAEPREDEAHDTETGVSRSARDFDEDERQVFGFNSGMYYPRNGRGADEYFGEAEAQERQSTAPSTFLGSPRDQRRGHRNRESSSAAVSSAAERVSSRFDPATQGFNLDFGAPPASMPRPPPPSGRVSVASVAPSRSTATRSRKSTGTKHYNKLPTEFARINREEGRERYYLDDSGTVYDRHPTPSSSVSSSTKSSKKPPPKPPAASAPAFTLPTRQRDLPTTREGFDALAKAINKAGGINGSFIQVYAGSSVANIKKNFIKRLNLAGKY